MTNNTSKSQYEVTKIRIFIAILLGAAIGAAFQVTDYAMQVYRTLGEEHFETYGMQKIQGMFILTSFLWLLGLLIIASPIWYMLHTRNKRSIIYALMLGFLCPFLFWLFMTTGFFTGMKSGGFSAGDNIGKTWENGRITLHGLTSALRSALWFGVQGLVVASVIWHVAYRFKAPNEKNEDITLQ